VFGVLIEVGMLEGPKLLCSYAPVRWPWGMLSWPTEQVAGKEGSFWFTKLTLKL